MKWQNKIKYMMKMSRVVLLLSFIFGYAAMHVSAQTNVVAPPGVSEQVTITTVPQQPQAGESVSVTIQSFSTNLNKSYITWSVNGVVKAEGPGKSSFTFVNGGLGAVTKVVVDITTEDLRSITKTLTFAPAKVGLVVEADTYTPPFYKGKALFTSESTLKVVAFPEFVTESGYRIPNENLVYNWRVDGDIVQASSGYGKSSFIVQGNIISRPFTVSVDVTAYNSPLTAEEAIEITPTSPEILVYEDSLLFGVRRETAFTSGLALTGREATLIAEPYFMSAYIPEASDLKYTWSLNGEQVSPLGRPNLIGLENRSGEAGIATLGLRIEHLQKLLQAPEISLGIEFSAIE